MTPRELLDAMTALRSGIADEAVGILEGWEPWIERDAFRPGAANLAHYLAARRRDLRPLQDELTLLGLSSLGRLESRVLPNLDAATASLAAVAGEPHPPPRPDAAALREGLRLLGEAADALFGPAGAARQVRILVTCPSESADDPAFFAALAEAGADAVRINCAHDDASAWARMAGNARRAEAATGRRLRVLMDLAGPKIGTGEVRLPEGRKRLEVDDRLLLARSGFADGPEAPPFQATCTLPGALDRLEVGHRVYVDDGRFG